MPYVRDVRQGGGSATITSINLGALHGTLAFPFIDCHTEHHHHTHFADDVMIMYMKGETPIAVAMATTEHPELSIWLVATEGWSPLRIAAGCRMHDDLVAALRVGALDPDMQAHRPAELLAAKQTAWAQAADLPWSSAPAICRETAQVVSAVIRGWSPASAWLHHAGVRRVVHAVLLISERLRQQHSAAIAATAVESAASNRSAAAASFSHASSSNALGNGIRIVAKALSSATVADVQTAPQQQLPLLPPEMWLNIMGFFQRKDWDVPPLGHIHQR